MLSVHIYRLFSGSEISTISGKKVDAAAPFHLAAPYREVLKKQLLSLLLLTCTVRFTSIITFYYICWNIAETCVPAVNQTGPCMSGPLKARSCDLQPSSSSRVSTRETELCSGVKASASNTLSFFLSRGDTSAQSAMNRCYFP